MLLTDVLTAEQGIALDIHWWVFANQPECAPLKEAIQKAFLLHWARCVTKLLKKNAGDPERRWPGTWKALAEAVDRDPGNLSRSRSTYIADTFLRLNCATALGVELHELEPPLHSWIASATRLLLTNSRCAEDVSEQDAWAYAAYVLRNPGPHEKCLVPERVSEVLDQQAAPRSRADLEQAIRRVGQLVGQFLKRHVPWVVNHVPRGNLNHR